MKNLYQLHQCKRRHSGFTLMELMAAIFISILIIGALYTIFSRVQGVFRIGYNQTRVLERGRALMDIIVRDLELMHAAINDENGLTLLGPSFKNLSARDFGVPTWTPDPPEKFMKLKDKWLGPFKLDDGTKQYPDGQVVFYEQTRQYYRHNATIANLHSTWAANPESGTNGNPWKFIPAEERRERIGVGSGSYDGTEFTSGDFFFLGRDRHWHAVGYGLYSPEGAAYPNHQLAGSLYRFHKVGELMEIDSVIRDQNLFFDSQEYQKIADGVVHLRLRAVSAADASRSLWVEPIFRGAHVPLYVEVEFGLLEEGLMREMEAQAEQHLPGSQEYFDAKKEVMNKNLNRIHMFRQVVPIRNNGLHFGHFGHGSLKFSSSSIMPLGPKRNSQNTGSTGSSSGGKWSADSPTTDPGVFRARGINTQVEGKGNRFVFIIDSSGSMNGKYELLDMNTLEFRWVTKYEMVQQALIDTLKTLKPNDYFYIYFYDHGPKPMGDPNMILADVPNKTRIGNWVNNTPLMGGWIEDDGVIVGTDPAGALEDAFHRLNPSTIWLLSDGRLNGRRGGQRIDYVQLINGLNPNGAVRVNTIGIGRTPHEADSALQKIARMHGGTYTFYVLGH